MALVSVIVPTHNSREFLPDALASVFEQTYSAIEILVVDDGSSDDSVEVARETLRTGSPYPWKVIERGRNGGPSAARNEGLGAARGAWVQFLDSDDLLKPRKLEHQMDAAASAPPDVAAVHSPWLSGAVGDDGASWEGNLGDPLFEGRAPITYFLPRVRPLLAAALVRKSVLDRVGRFDESLRFWECEELCFRVAAEGRFEAVASTEPLYLWRQPDGREYIGNEHAKYDSRQVGLAWMRRMLEATGGRSFDELRLSDEDRGLILDECTQWARTLRGCDREAFSQYMLGLRTLEPRFRPTGPWYLSLLSLLLSYEGAECVAEKVRRLKNLKWSAIGAMTLDALSS